MEFLTQLFGSFDYLTEVSSILIAVAGVIATYRGYRFAGISIAFGGALLFLGRTTMFLATQITPLTDLLISLMFPGLFLFAAGSCLLVWQLPKKIDPVPNKGFNRTPESSGAAKPGEFSGGAG